MAIFSQKCIVLLFFLVIWYKTIIFLCLRFAQKQAFSFVNFIKHQFACDENGEKWPVYPGKPSKRCPFYPGKPSQKCPSYPSGQTKQKLAILPEWVNPANNDHFTRMGKYSQKCPFCLRTSIHSTKLVIPHGTIFKKHEIILARAKALQ